MSTENTVIKVAIADDHEIFRDGLKLMLQHAEHIDVVGEAADGKELLQVIKEMNPHVVITDIKMPVMDGVETAKYIKANYPDIKIIALSMYDDEQLILEMLEAGATGYLLKNSDKAEVIEAVQTVYEDIPYYCKFTSARLANLIAFSKRNDKKKQKEAEFSDREKEIICLMCEEYSNKEIAEKLFISQRTIEGIRMKILEKMNARNIAGVVVEAIRLGIYTPPK
jgi:DNA-binding NarL/FixJ family response regulator